MYFQKQRNLFKLFTWEVFNGPIDIFPLRRPHAAKLFSVCEVQDFKSFPMDKTIHSILSEREGCEEEGWSK